MFSPHINKNPFNSSVQLISSPQTNIHTHKQTYIGKHTCIRILELWWQVARVLWIMYKYFLVQVMLYIRMSLYYSFFHLSVHNSDGLKF